MIRAKEREVRSPLATAAMLVAVLSVAAAGYFGWQWGTTDDAGPRVVIGQDSGVLEEARVAVVALTTLDSAKPQQSIRQ